MTDSEEGLRKWRIYLYGASVGRSRGAFFSGYQKLYEMEGSGDGHFSMGAPLGSLVACSSAGDLRKLCRRKSLPTGAPWNIWGGVRSPETLR
jgi:hypothetical protein